MLLVENVLHEFLNDFLNKRNLPFPDGRMLYAYQMNQREYLELKEKLNELCQNEELVDLLRNKDFSRCFVLYASEWWKREYSGGVWTRMRPEAVCGQARFGDNSVGKLRGIL